MSQKEIREKDKISKLFSETILSYRENAIGGDFVIRCFLLSNLKYRDKYYIFK